MTQKEKQLLLKDLCARLPYKVKVSLVEPERDEFTSKLSYENGRTLTGVLRAVYPDENRVIIDELSEPIAQYDVRCGGFNLDEYKITPYLRPMSSITGDYAGILKCVGNGDLYIYEVTDWLNKHHFDFRNLIERGLAIDCTNLDIY